MITIINKSIKHRNNQFFIYNGARRYKQKIGVEVMRTQFFVHNSARRYKQKDWVEVMRPQFYFLNI